MLSRRFLRAKVLQSVYSFTIGNDADLVKSRQNLIESIENITDLMCFQLSALLELRDFAENKIEENMKKLIPTKDDINPNRKFVDNLFFEEVRNSSYFQTQFKSLNINWSDFEDLFRKIYNSLVEWPEYKKFLTDGDNSFQNNTIFAAKVFKKFIAFDGVLRTYYEEMNIYWSEDSVIASIILNQWIKNFNPEKHSTTVFEKVFKESKLIGNDNDKDFVKNLFDKTIINSDKYNKLIEEKISNWNIERVNQIDVLLLKMALTEILEFPVIPIKATINEYIDLSKEYSTPKSNSFINGVLDKLVADLKKEGLINKTGRGLKEK